MPLIEVTSGPHKGLRLPLAEADLTVGSAERCQLRLEGTGIAPEHCVLSLRDGRPIIEDRGSPTGTFVNYQRVERCELGEADVIFVGRTKLVFHAEPAAPAPGMDLTRRLGSSSVPDPRPTEPDPPPADRNADSLAALPVELVVACRRVSEMLAERNALIDRLTKDNENLRRELEALRGNRSDASAHGC